MVKKREGWGCKEKVRGQLEYTLEKWWEMGGATRSIRVGTWWGNGQGNEEFGRVGWEEKGNGGEMMDGRV